MTALHTYQAVMMALMNLWNHCHRIQRRAHLPICVWKVMGMSFWCPSPHPWSNSTTARTSRCEALFNGFIVTILAAQQNAVSFFPATPIPWRLSSTVVTKTRNQRKTPKTSQNQPKPPKTTNKTSQNQPKPPTKPTKTTQNKLQYTLIRPVCVIFA